MKTTRKSAFTLVEVMIVFAIIGLLAAIAIPNFVKARNTSCMNASAHVAGKEYTKVFDETLAKMTSSTLTNAVPAAEAARQAAAAANTASNLTYWTHLGSLAPSLTNGVAFAQ